MPEKAVGSCMLCAKNKSLSSREVLKTLQDSTGCGYVLLENREQRLLQIDIAFYMHGQEDVM